MVICTLTDAPMGEDNLTNRFIEYVTIFTLEGKMRGDLGDWVIVGLGGELYPCKHDIFINSYEEIDE